MDELGIGGDGLAAPEAVGDERPQTTIWAELNAWGKSIADWKRYIISHAVRDGTLADARIDEAYRLFPRDSKPRRAHHVRGAWGTNINFRNHSTGST